MWYAAPLDVALGVRHIFLIVLGVDAALGPLITLIIYKKGKKSLVIDLSIVVLIQLAALVYGVHTVAVARPVWVAFNVDRFDVIQANEIDDKYRTSAKPEYQSLSWTGPRWVAVAPADDPQARSEMLIEVMAGAPDLPFRPVLYQSLDSLHSAIREREKTLEELNKTNPTTEVQAILADWPNATAWLPLSARQQDMVVLLDDQQQVLSVVDLRPWE